jgi:hypothetical protein
MVTVPGRTLNPRGVTGAPDAVGGVGVSGAVVSPAQAANKTKAVSMAKSRKIASLRASL